MTTSPASFARLSSSTVAVRASLDRLAALNPTLNAFLDTFPDDAVRAARDADNLAAGQRAAKPLAGIPIAIKDNLCLGRGRTTCGSRMLEDYRSPYTATAVQKLIDAGAIVIGKTNMDEFGMGSSGEHSAFGPTRNPWDITRVPGGSSSGSAAAVAAGIVPAALGSDTGGSVRQPASLCNLVGLKPTYGRISRYGLVAYASSLDQVGTLTRSVADAAAMLNVLAGPDPNDATSLHVPPEDFAADLDTPVNNLVLGVPRQARSSANHPAVTGALDAAIAAYRSLGALVIDVDLPNLQHAVAAYYIIATAEASSNLARFDGIRYGKRAAADTLDDLYSRSRAEFLGPEVQRRIMLGTHALSAGYYDAYYLTALKVRRLIKQDFDAAFGPAAGRPPCHAILMPVAPSPAFKLGEKTADPMALYLEDIYTVPVNLAGLPAISIPAGFTPPSPNPPSQNPPSPTAPPPLPIGLQLIAPALAESCLLRAARMFEQAHNFAARQPPPLPSPTS